MAMFFFQEGFTYRNFLTDVVTIFLFIVWFWLLITVASDLFRRHDISGWGKAIWVIGWIVFPFVFMLAYLILQGKGMAERNLQRVQQARDEIRSAVAFSVADEIEKLDRLRKAGSISDAEYARLRARLMQ
jgi:L-lactate permease